MKNWHKIVGFVMLGGVVFTSCKDKDPQTCDNTDPGTTLKVTVQPVYGTENLHLDSIYTTTEGYKVKFTDLKFYMGSPRNNGKTLTEAGLFDYRENGTTVFSAKGEVADYGNLDAYLGVHASLNHNDPVGFDDDSPLHITNANDMHWSWNPGYIFLKVEAKVDTLNDATDLFNHNVVFHIGADENIQDFDFDNVNWVDLGTESVFQLKLDMAAFLQNGSQIIDLKDEHISHTAPGQEALSEKVIKNFKDAITPL